MGRLDNMATKPTTSYTLPSAPKPASKAAPVQTTAQLVKQAATLQASVNQQIADLQPKVSAAYQSADPVGFAQQALSAASPGSAAYTTALRNLNTARDQEAQTNTPKPPLDTTQQMRGDTYSWDPKNQKWNVIKGPNVVSGGGPVLGGGGGGGGPQDNTKALADLAAKQAADKKAADAQNAFVTFKARFTALGLGSLADAMVSISTSANPPTTDAGYYLALLDTPEYKTRFGDTNAMRIKNGLPALSEADIMKSEENIRNTMKAYNMPAGFYDQPQDLQTFIALDKSAAEVGDIIKAYQDIAKTVNPDTSKALETYYGIGLSGITAALMDPAKAQPVLNAIAQKGTSAAAAASAGITDVTGYAQVAQGMGAGTLDYAKQAQAFAQAQSMSQQVGTLSNIYSGAIGAGSLYNTAQALQETLGGPEAEQAKLARERLTTQELSSFGGSAGASAQGQSLGIGTQQGVQ